MLSGLKNPLEEYLNSVISQYKTDLEVLDTELTQLRLESTAAEESALSALLREDFITPGLRKGLLPEEALKADSVIKDTLAKQISASIQAETAEAQAALLQERENLLLELAAQSKRIAHLQQTGLTELLKHTPPNPAYRTQVVFDPATGKAHQEPTHYDQAEVRIKELADYLQIPEPVVANTLFEEALRKQEFLARQEERAYTKLRRQQIQEDRQARIARLQQEQALKRYNRSVDWAIKIAKGGTRLLELMKNNPNLPEDYRTAIPFVESLIRNREAILAEKTLKRQIDKASQLLISNPKYKELLLSGKISDELNQEMIKLVLLKLRTDPVLRLGKEAISLWEKYQEIFGEGSVLEKIITEAFQPTQDPESLSSLASQLFEDEFSDASDIEIPPPSGVREEPLAQLKSLLQQQKPPQEIQREALELLGITPPTTTGEGIETGEKSGEDELTDELDELLKLLEE